MEKLEYLFNSFPEGKEIKNISLSAVHSVDKLFCFISDLNNTYHACIRFSGTIDEIIKQFESYFSNHTIEEVHLFYSIRTFTTIPRELFLYGSEHLYLKNIRKKYAKQVSFSEQLYDEKAVLVYDLPLDAELNFRQNIKNLRTKHLLHLLIGQSATFYDSCFCYVLESELYLILRDKEKIQLISSHEYKSKEDILYVLAKMRNDFGQLKIIIAGLSKELHMFDNFLSEHMGLVNLYSEDLVGSSMMILQKHDN